MIGLGFDKRLSGDDKEEEDDDYNDEYYDGDDDDNVDNRDEDDAKNDDDDDRHGSCLIADERCQLEAADSGCEAPLEPQLWPIRPQQNELRKYVLYFLQRSRSRKMHNDK